MLYINFYFKELEYDEDYIRGEFFAPDADVFCKFKYFRETMRVEIWENNKPVEEILPLPIWWLLLKIEKNGKLNENECKISY